MNLGVVHKNQF